MCMYVCMYIFVCVCIYIYAGCNEHRAPPPPLTWDCILHGIKTLILCVIMFRIIKVCVCVCVCVYIYIYIHACVCVCVCVYTVICIHM